MVFGFGFNKTKVLASAERNVKQGKLQNAILDYEKILAEDPKDLTVMNTVGDLYSRVGNSEKATEYFRKIGDVYAADGFTVRAIAMYKKVTKQNPTATEAVQKLGDLYTQQGLYNDARAQYLQVAENALRNNDLQQAAAVFQKSLQLDPENSSLQTRLAELYIRIGRAADARDLYFRNAEALRTRGALDLADDALAKVCKLDPNFGPAILMRGQVKFDSGDPEGAIKILEKVPDLDSRPEGLRTLLRSYLSLGRLDNSEPVARKLLQVYNDPSGVAGYGEALIAGGEYEKALDFFSEHAGVMLASNQAGFLQTLQSLTGRVKNSPKALEQLSAIFQRAGNTGSSSEITELLAHAYVQQGELTKARDLYQRLTTLEPDNPQHAQNYRQILSRLSESLPPEPEPTAQAPERKPQSARPQPPRVESSSPLPEFEVEQEPHDAEEASGETFSPEDTFPPSQVEQKYPGDIGELIEAALTDAELFDSYNLVSKAIAPLEILLPRVPHDVRVNQRLASLYARSGRLKDAAERCAVLEKVHVIAGFLKDSRFYSELAAKYRQRAGVAATAQPAPDVAAAPAAPPVAAPVAATPARVEPSVPPPSPAPAPSRPAPTPKPAPVAAQSSVPQPTHEIDLSSEWEEMLEVEHHPAQAEERPAEKRPAPPQHFVPAEEHPAPVQHVEPVQPVQPPEIPHVPAAPPRQAIPQPETTVSAWDDTSTGEDSLPELLDEVRFYISQGMWPEAQTALTRCALIDPTHPEVRELHVQLATFEAGATETPEFEVEATETTHFEPEIPEPPVVAPPAPERIVLPPPPPVPEPRVLHPPVLETKAAPPVAISAHEATVREFEFTGDEQVPTESYEETGVDPLLMSPDADISQEHTTVTSYEPTVYEPVLSAYDIPTSPHPEPAHSEPVYYEQEIEVPQFEPYVPSPPANVPAISQHAAAASIPTTPEYEPLTPVYEPPAPPPTTVREPKIAAKPATPVHEVPVAPPVVAPPPAATPPHVLDSFVKDLEASLGDFSLDEPQAEMVEAEDEVEEVAEPRSATVVTPAIPHVEAIPAVAVSPVVPVTEVPAPPSPPAVTAPAMVQPPIPAASLEEERGALNDIFAEFKESVESGGDEKEDPETHYNLGVAFKEMDLFDEAIGEFQKVCKAIERGHDFPQRIQAYTWLADCFLRKGVPDLAVRWYERALTANHLDYDTDTAIRYELACACDAAGDRQAALSHFMEVYGTNIDYRDVAERIKSLRQ